jgi:uncharacterized protein (TIGR00369 family)
MDIGQRRRAMPPTVLDGFPMPPCARLLGWRLIDAKPEIGWVQIAFEAKPEFCNPAGFVQGGFLAAMLDDAMGPAVLVKSDGALYTATIDLQVSFLAPAKTGLLTAEATVVQIGKTIGFIEGKLTDADGVVVAKATASARLIPTAKAVA